MQAVQTCDWARACESPVGLANFFMLQVQSFVNFHIASTCDL